MNNDSYKAWIDAMPIDDVRRRIERLERKLSDLHVLERLYAERHGGSDAAHEAEPAPDHEDHAEGGAPQDDAGAQGEEHGGGAPEGGGWTHGESAPEHG